MTTELPTVIQFWLKRGFLSDTLDREGSAHDGMSTNMIREQTLLRPQEAVTEQSTLRQASFFLCTP